MNIALTKWTTQDLAFIKELDPLIIPACIELKCRWAMAGHYNRITSGKRTAQEQFRLYLIGRPWFELGTAGRAVTWVTCPRSWHCHGLAIDIAPLFRLSEGNPLNYGLDWLMLDQMAPHAMSVGFDWGFAKWGRDKPHFHYSGGLSIQQIIDGERPPPPLFVPSDKPKNLIRGINRVLKNLDMLEYELPFPT